MITLHHIKSSSTTKGNDAAIIDRVFCIGLCNNIRLCWYTFQNDTIVFLSHYHALCNSFNEGQLPESEAHEIWVCTRDMCSDGTFNVWPRMQVRVYVWMLHGSCIVRAVGVGFGRDSNREGGEVLGMLVKDLLGYQRTRAFCQFSAEE